MTLPLLILASQLADGLAYQLAAGHGIEANPAASALAALGPFALLAVKLAAGCILALGGLAIQRRRPGLAASLALVGFAGCLSELVVLA